MSTTVRTVEISAPPEKIWAIVSDGNRWPEWLTPVGQLEERAPPLTDGAEFHVAIGKMGGAKVKVKEVSPNRRLRWNVGPGMAHMMGMPMKATLELQPQGGNRTRVTFTMLTPMMMAPMMGMMTGLRSKDETGKTVEQLRRVIEGGGATPTQATPAMDMKDMVTALASMPENQRTEMMAERLNMFYEMPPAERDAGMKAMMMAREGLPADKKKAVVESMNKAMANLPGERAKVLMETQERLMASMG